MSTYDCAVVLSLHHSYFEIGFEMPDGNADSFDQYLLVTPHKQENRLASLVTKYNNWPIKKVARCDTYIVMSMILRGKNELCTIDNDLSISSIGQHS